MIVDIIFVALVLILIFTIYKLKFKNDAAKIAASNIHQHQQQTPKINQQNLQKQEKPLVDENKGPRWNQQRWQQDPELQQNSSNESDQQGQSTSFADRRKQMRKQEKAKLKQQRKQALEYHLKEEKQKKQKQQQQEQQKQRIEQQKRKKEQEHYRMLVQQEEKRKKAEYEQWKGMFKVETEGKSKDSAEVQNMKKEELLKSLLKNLQKNKLSLLQDLAHKFKLATKELIQKIKQLEGRGEVKGIFDERGKYLVIEQREWEAIRNYIEARGRIKKTDIMQQCAKIIKIPQVSELDEEMLSLIEKEGDNQG